MIDAASIVSQIMGVLGEPKRGSGQELTWNCPLCVIRKQARADTRYRLYVNPYKKFTKRGQYSESGWAFCQNCQWAGPVASLLKQLGIEVEAKAEDWSTILTRLAKVGEPPEPDPFDEEFLDTVSYPCAVYPLEPDMRSWAYLTKRGITPKQIRTLQLGVGSKRYRNRIFFPNFNEDGEMDFWSAREFGSDYGPKYISSPGAPRRERIYRYQAVARAIRSGVCTSVTITEGVISAIRAGEDAVACFGKYVTPEQQRMLLDLRKFALNEELEYVIALDGDALLFSTGLAKALHARGAHVSIVPLPRNHDPASLEPEEWAQLRAHPMKYDGVLSGMRVMLCGIGG